ncbi:xylose isomerase-like protein [Mycena latifolia]|nr:xylose isomerase-like protein [Mycena latifolia]
MLRAFSPRHLIQLGTTSNRLHFITLTMPKRKISNETAPGLLETDLPNPAKKLKSAKGKAKSKVAEPPQYAERSDSLWKVGAHVSAAGGIENAIINAAAIGANSFALFVKSQRKWTSPALTEASISGFNAQMAKHGYDPRHILPHGSYLINLGNPDAEKRQKSYDCFLDDLKRCEALGLQLYNFHPGSSVGQATTDEAISFIAESINEAHRATETVITVLENMAGAGNIIGGDFNHLANIISQVDDKSRVGGYDLRAKEDWEQIVADFDQQIGLSYLRGMHLNDSKTACNSKRDRHEILDVSFHHILNDVRFQNIPLILETPSFEKPEVWATEIGVFNGLSGADAGDLESVVDGVKEVVKRSEASKPKKAPKKTAAKKGKKKSKAADSDAESDSEGEE